MKIAIFGTGFVGSALASELAERGQEVVVVARHPAPGLPACIVTVTGSVYDPDTVAEATAGIDVIVNAVIPVDEQGGLPSSTQVLAEAAEKSGARLGVVGSSAILPVRPGGPRHADTPGFPDFLADRVDAHDRTLDWLRSTPETLDWIYLAVAGEFGRFAPGTRTGRYRTSTTAQVHDADGRSHIGVADFAIAYADEVLTPTVHRDWLTVGY
ncbi:NAD(P)H-binding protein [Phycicoccus sp. CSK15P-2]|uniref:NAD(P)-dependent oxidoreductase n=1 Tax=Phycicoccus sp. CSK15P-2 TaxID=2807627 RepID=UPI001952108C|nr:NAD(P)H-binding protein [Phycicoccus sp. CSK15P-2]MBM6402654.1 NAD(P)H-binding protein [Phycicoccus sp. CSK15P-2]